MMITAAKECWGH